MTNFEQEMKCLADYCQEFGCSKREAMEEFCVRMVIG